MVNRASRTGSVGMARGGNQTSSKQFCPMRFLLALLLFSFVAAPQAHADRLTGVASVTDGDTLEIRGQRIRLHEIDAPESRQLCATAEGQRWRCGQ